MAFSHINLDAPTTREVAAAGAELILFTALSDQREQMERLAAEVLPELGLHRIPLLSSGAATGAGPAAARIGQAWLPELRVQRPDRYAAVPAPARFPAAL